MAEAGVRYETPAEYFREMVDSALARLSLSPEEATRYYLVTLLTSFVRVDRAPAGGAPPAEPLGPRLIQTLDAHPVQRRTDLRNVGDACLFLTGFFGDCLDRKLIDPDYYITLGSCAYRSLGDDEDLMLSETFAELALNFVAFVDVLAEVSERASLATCSDLLRCYERWLRTGSRRAFGRLIEQGIVPSRQPGALRTQ